jgi:hypothetical protein
MQWKNICNFVLTNPNNRMHIANPIYDVVFKYLMEDNKIAKLMLSSIIGEEIEELTFLPQEFIMDMDKTGKKRRKKIKTSLTVYRLDFSAKIQTAEGLKQVLIELQKAKFPTDIMRFRRYLGEQFSNKANTQSVKVGTRVRKTGIPLISIYFLGHKLDHTTAGAIKISRQYEDLMTGEIITTKEDFIESLTLDSYVIQIPYISDKRRNDLEILLRIFDQSQAIDKDTHILSVEESDFPEKYRPIIRKLRQAIETAEIKKTMVLEDGIIDELEDKEREIEELEVKVETMEVKMETMGQENEQVKQKLGITEQEKQKAEQEKQKAEQEKQKAEQENEKLKEELEQMRQLLKGKK